MCIHTNLLTSKDKRQNSSDLDYRQGEEGWFAAKIKGLRVTTAAVPRVPTSFNVEYPDGEIEVNHICAHIEC